MSGWGISGSNGPRILMGATGDGPYRGGRLVIEPTSAHLGQQIVISGLWLQRERQEGSAAYPLADAHFELAFLPARWGAAAHVHDVYPLP